MLKKYATKFLLVYICYGISALAVFLANFVSSDSGDSKNILAAVFGTFFWLGLFAGWFIYRSTAQIKIQARALLVNGKYRPQKHWGIITFSKKGTHIALYVVITVGVLLVLMEIISGYIPNKILLLIIAITYYAVLLHCVIDGENYKKYLFIKDGMSNATDE